MARSSIGRPTDETRLLCEPASAALVEALRRLN
jgi:hypothetical protein